MLSASTKSTDRISHRYGLFFVKTLDKAMKSSYIFYDNWVVR